MMFRLAFFIHCIVVVAAFVSPQLKLSTSRSATFAISGINQSNLGDNGAEDETSTPMTTDGTALTRRNTLQLVTAMPLIDLFYPLSVEAASDQRCDPGDPRCGADGTLRNENPLGKPIPRVTNEITHVVQITYNVGERREEVGFLRLGLYGKDCPKSVKQMLQFLSNGISSMTDEQRSNTIGMQTAPVGLLGGGIVPMIASGATVEFGVPSQSKAFAATRGMRTAGSDFVPQPRPPSLEEEGFPRPHEVAGLVSIPAKGIGYGGRGATESEDEVFANAFLVTADATPTFDSAKLKRRVIGQVIDDKSMAFLARLASLPVQKGIAGVIPGKVSGPPLLKVTVQDVGIQKVQADKKKSSKKK